MSRKRFAIVAALALTFAALVASHAGQRALGLQAGHNLLHVNCPPGSHGKPRYTGVGQQLDNARDEARAARSLDTRAVTAR